MSVSSARAAVGELREDRREYVEAYFKTAPDWLWEAMQVVEVGNDRTFINEGEDADKVYILLKGKVVGIDYRVKEIAYGYLQFQAVEVLGAMEIMLNLDKYKATLKTLEDCLFLCVDNDIFAKWMRNDINAYRMQVEKTGTYLLEETRKERLYVLIHGEERIYLALYQLYQLYAKNGVCNIYVSRKEFMQMTGVSERTVTRTVTDLANRGYLAKDGWNLVITEEQHKKIRVLIEEKIQELGVSKYELF